jgi:glycosyltransferase involved in cell wall biosynthesis
VKKIAISATNPCHLYDLAKVLHARGALGAYFSGYPRWKLDPPPGFPLRAHSLRTLVTYGALRLPRRLRPAERRLFTWQDTGFDRAVSRDLVSGDGAMIHAMPGQALETFRAAKAAGMETCLNHASGPVRQQLRLVEAEYARVDLDASKLHRFDAAYFARESQEYALADWHCAASSVVRSQLEAEGVDPGRIWVVPYGADPARFHRPATSAAPRERRIIFAGQLTLRKGLRTLFDAFAEMAGDASTTLDCFGSIGTDIAADLAGVRNQHQIRLHGPVTQTRLAEEFRRASLLVLPSWEEAFGLVVPQALNCGLPCVVSDRVGAKDLIRHRQNGSVFPVGDATALAAEIDWWVNHPGAFNDTMHTWEEPAGQLLSYLTAQDLPSASPQ